MQFICGCQNAFIDLLRDERRPANFTFPIPAC